MPTVEHEYRGVHAYHRSRTATLIILITHCTVITYCLRVVDGGNGGGTVVGELKCGGDAEVGERI